MGAVVQAFTADQVCALTGLSPRQVRYWTTTEFIAPGVASDPPLFSFRDLVGLRVLGILRNEHKIPLQELRKVGWRLKHYHDTPWSGLALFIDGRRVCFEDPGTGIRHEAGGAGQAYLPKIELLRVEADTSKRVAALRARRPEQRGTIERARNIARNAPRIAGTRIPTEAIWSFHEAGYDHAQIAKEYPSLTEDDVRAAVAYEEDRREKLRRRSA
jgi:uncharacterized protein (DUF433 family)